MKSAWRRLHLTCLPFVTRSLRGNRLRRTVALSILLAVFSVFTGSWLALGGGAFERDVRTSFGLEQSLWERPEHAVFVHDEHTLAALRDERAAILRQGIVHAVEWGQVAGKMREGAATLQAAAISEPPEQHRALWEGARALLDDGGHVLLDEAGWRQSFDWTDAHHVASLEDIVETGLLPRVELYRSPLGLAGMITLVGLVGGGALIFGLLVAGPLMVGTQIAQEAHENTLQPLTGTALSQRGLAVGLSAGPCAVLGLLLAPQAVLMLGACLVGGYAWAALGVVVVGLAGCALLSTVCALAGLSMGRKQSPGLVAIALLALLVVPFFIGLGIGFELEAETLGVLTILPQAGAVHLLRDALAPAGQLGFHEAITADVRLGVGLATFAVLTAIGILALERRIAGRPGPTLRRREVFVAAAMLVVASILAMPRHYGFDEAHVLGSLALVVLPFMLLVMARVPVGMQAELDARTRRRRALLCLGEFAGFVALHAFFAAIVGGPAALEGFGPAALFNLGWGLAIAALVAVRSVSIPARLPGMFYLTFCLSMAAIAYVTGCVFACDGGTNDPLFAFWEVSPVLGVVQVVLTVLIPWSLLRTSRRG